MAYRCFCLLLVIAGKSFGGREETSIPYQPYTFSKDEKDSAKGKTVLVTGAAGFIGSHVARHCRDLGLKVVAIDDLSGGFTSNVPSGVTFMRLDVRDAEAMEGLFEEYKFDFVYHLAAYAAEGLSHFVRSFNYRTNLVGSVEILNAAVRHKVHTFVFTSSIAVFGPLNDDLEYAFEMDLRAAHDMWGINFVVFRPHNVYGPHQNMYRNVVGIFVNQIIHGKPLTIFGDGQQLRAFSYIDDVAPIISRAPLVKAAHNEVFNIGADTPYNINRLATEISRAMGKPDHPSQVVNAVASHEKVRRIFAPPETVDLVTGLQRTVEWYNVVGASFTPVEFESVEVIDKMPPSWIRPGLAERPACQGTRVGESSLHNPSGTFRGVTELFPGGGVSVVAPLLLLLGLGVLMIGIRLLRGRHGDGKVPKDGSRPIIDVTDEASGVKEENVTYNTGEALSYDYYNIRLTNVELIRRLGPVEVDSISSLGTPKGLFTYLSPKFKEGRDTRFYRNELCREARSIEPVIPKALNIRTHHPHMPQGSYCAHWSKENISLKLEFVGGGKPALNVYELSSNKFEMNAHYDTDVMPVDSVQDMWGFRIKLKAQDLIKAVGTEKLKVLQQLYFIVRN
ncbi:hypothetical protein FOZ60_015178 [Perkinsus olseni]|uniref:NAD-dependent epimerase/dehydratase domain-containing protein n=1 Tax=Perkinsus olseni TaxID=32597 RepID=A0A7J6P641_PEROL|nr:hypothetical protein FOZ60_015178 [Perkinsus olseni]